ncbi:carbohydrate ABC transporter permease [Paenibacillus harenae]|uniref:carbohydrate ABC transporter permease n=1 Tax=Paenibacillus harenae TaxID=306543 RepID=UPI00278D2DC4|nr:sugar ABC transporter permease [Paenibacillus harenae]MDQ0058654.1 multiple sugar transport system permease protein [Paenibacillus harenae]
MPAHEQPASYRSHKRRRIWAGYLFILPSILGIIIFTLAPLIYSFYLSFTNWTVLAPKKWIGFANYEKIFTNDYFFYKSLKVTAYYSLGSVVAIVVICFIIAMLLNSAKRAKAFFRAAFYLPTVIPVLAGSICWIWMFNVDFGIINYALSFVGIDKQYWVGAPDSVIPSLILIAVWGAGNVIVIFMAGMQDVPRHLLEAVEIDGGGWWRKLRSVTIPLVSPVIFYNVILAFINSLTAFTQTYVLGRNGGGPNDSALFYSFLIYREAFKYQNMGYACALAMVLFVIVGFFTYLLFKLSSRWVHYEGGGK